MLWDLGQDRGWLFLCSRFGGLLHMMIVPRLADPIGDHRFDLCFFGGGKRHMPKGHLHLGTNTLQAEGLPPKENGRKSSLITAADMGELFCHKF